MKKKRSANDHNSTSHEIGILVFLTLVIFSGAVGFPTLINTSPTFGYDDNTIAKLTPVTTYYQQAFAEQEAFETLSKYYFDPILASSLLLMPTSLDFPPEDPLQYFERKYSQGIDIDFGFIPFDSIEELFNPQHAYADAPIASLLGDNLADIDFLVVTGSSSGFIGQQFTPTAPFPDPNHISQGSIVSIEKLSLQVNDTSNLVSAEITGIVMRNVTETGNVADLIVLGTSDTIILDGSAPFDKTFPQTITFNFTTPVEVSFDGTSFIGFNITNADGLRLAQHSIAQQQGFVGSCVTGNYTGSFERCDVAGGIWQGIGDVEQFGIEILINDTSKQFESIGGIEPSKLVVHHTFDFEQANNMTGITNQTTNGSFGTNSTFSNTGTFGSDADAVKYVDRSMDNGTADVGVQATGFTWNSTGLIGGAVRNDATDPLIVGSEATKNQFNFFTNAETDTWSANFWIRQTTVLFTGSPADQGIFMHTMNSINQNNMAFYQFGGNVGLYLQTDGTENLAVGTNTTATIPADFDWHMLTYIVEKSNATSIVKICIDASCENIDPDVVFAGGDLIIDGTLFINDEADQRHFEPAFDSLSGIEWEMDEVSIWEDYKLTNADRTTLYNSGVGSSGVVAENGTLDTGVDGGFIAEFDIEFSSFPVSPRALPLAFSDINQDIDGNTDDNDILAVMARNNGVNDGLRILFVDNGDATSGGCGVELCLSSGIDLSTGVTYYPRLERVNATFAELSVFTDSERTTHVSGSPVSAIINATIDGLRYVHSQHMSDQSQTTSGTIDNLVIGNLINSFGDDFSTNSSWTQTGTGVTITDGEVVGWTAFAGDQRITHDLGFILDEGDTPSTTPQNLSATVQVDPDKVNLDWDDVVPAPTIYNIFKGFNSTANNSNEINTNATWQYREGLVDAQPTFAPLCTFNVVGSGSTGHVSMGSTGSNNLSDCFLWKEFPRGFLNATQIQIKYEFTNSVGGSNTLTFRTDTFVDGEQQDRNDESDWGGTNKNWGAVGITEDNIESDGGTLNGGVLTSDLVASEGSWDTVDTEFARIVIDMNDGSILSQATLVKIFWINITDHDTGSPKAFYNFSGSTDNLETQDAGCTPDCERGTFEVGTAILSDFFEQIGTSVTSDFMDLNPNINTEVFYKVNADGGTNSTDLAFTFIFPDTVPSAITDLTATLTNSIFLEWTAPDDGGSPITGYEIQRSRTDIARNGTYFDWLKVDGGFLREAEMSADSQDGVDGELLTSASEGFVGQAVNVTSDAEVGVVEVSFHRQTVTACSGSADLQGAIFFDNGTRVENSTNTFDVCTVSTDRNDEQNLFIFNNTEISSGNEYVFGVEKIGTNTDGDIDVHTILNTKRIAVGFTTRDISSPPFVFTNSTDEETAVSVYTLNFTTIVTDTGNTNTNFTDNSCPNGITCYYRAQAINGIGTAGKSNIVNATEPIIAGVSLFEDDFDTDAWLDQNTDIFVDTTGETIDFNASDSQLNHATSFDLGTVLDDSWQLRFKYSIDNLVQGADPTGSILTIGLGDTSSATPSGTSQDLIGLRHLINDANQVFQLIDVDGVTVESVGADSTFTTVPSVGDVWIEIVRVSGISYRISIYSDSEFRNVIESQIGTTSALNTGLQFIKVFSADSGDGTEDHILDGTIDDVQFVDLVGVEQFSDDFNTDDWTDNGSTVGVNLSTDVLDFTTTTDSDGAYIDLGTPLSDQEWKLRFELNVTSETGTNNRLLQFGLWDNTVFDATTTQDSIIFMLQKIDPDNFFYVAGGDGVNAVSIPNTQLTTHNPVAPDVFYVELERVNTTLAEVEIFSNSNYTGLLDSGSVVIPSTITGLQIIKARIWDSFGSGVITGTIDDLQLFSNGELDSKWSYRSHDPEYGVGAVASSCLTGLGHCGNIADVTHLLLNYSSAFTGHFYPNSPVIDAGFTSSGSAPSLDGEGYIFKTFTRDSIIDQNITIAWEQDGGGGSSRPPFIKVYDGAYIAENAVDFPYNFDIDLKGGGLIGSCRAVAGGSSVPEEILNCLANDDGNDPLGVIDIDYSLSTEDFITVMINQEESRLDTKNLHPFNMTISNLGFWNFSNQQITATRGIAQDRDVSFDEEAGFYSQGQVLDLTSPPAPPVVEDPPNIVTDLRVNIQNFTEIMAGGGTDSLEDVDLYPAMMLQTIPTQSNPTLIDSFKFRITDDVIVAGGTIGTIKGVIIGDRTGDLDFDSLLSDIYFIENASQTYSSLQTYPNTFNFNFSGNTIIDSNDDKIGVGIVISNHTRELRATPDTNTGTGIISGEALFLGNICGSLTTFERDGCSDSDTSDLLDMQIFGGNARAFLDWSDPTVTPPEPTFFDDFTGILKGWESSDLTTAFVDTSTDTLNYTDVDNDGKSRISINLESMGIDVDEDIFSLRTEWTQLTDSGTGTPEAIIAGLSEESALDIIGTDVCQSGGGAGASDNDCYTLFYRSGGHNQWQIFGSNSTEGANANLKLGFDQGLHTKVFPEIVVADGLLRATVYSDSNYTTILNGDVTSTISLDSHVQTNDLKHIILGELDNNSVGTGDSGSFDSVSFWNGINITDFAGSGTAPTGYEIHIANATAITLLEERFNFATRHEIGTEADNNGFAGQRITFPTDTVLQSFYVGLGDNTAVSNVGIIQGVVLKDAPNGTSVFTRVANSTNDIDCSITAECEAPSFPLNNNEEIHQNISSSGTETFTFDNVVLTGGVEYIIGIEVDGFVQDDSDILATAINQTSVHSHPYAGLGNFTYLDVNTGDIWNTTNDEYSISMYGYNYTLETSNTGSTLTEYTSTADFPAFADSINAYSYLIHPISASGSGNASNFVEASPDRSASFDAWQFVERNARLFFWVDCTFENDEFTEEFVLTERGLGNCFLFKTFDKSLINGSDIRVVFTQDTGHQRLRTFVMDGGYDKDSKTDFPDHAGFLLKGAGFLNSTDFLNDGINIDYVIPESDIDYISSTEEEITVIMATTHSGFPNPNGVRGNMSAIEISKVGSWNFTQNPRITYSINLGQNEADNFNNKMDDRGVVTSNSIFIGNVTVIPPPPVAPEPITDLQVRIQNTTQIFDGGIVSNTEDQNIFPSFILQTIPTQTNPTLIDSFTTTLDDNAIVSGGIIGEITGVIIGDKTGDLDFDSLLENIYFIENSTQTFSTSQTYPVTLTFNFSGNTILDSNDNKVGVGVVISNHTRDIRVFLDSDDGTGITAGTALFLGNACGSATIFEKENCLDGSVKDLQEIDIYGGNARAVLNWTAPADNGDAITGYEVTRANSTQQIIYDEEVELSSICSTTPSDGRCENIGSLADPLGFAGQRITFPTDVKLTDIMLNMGFRDEFPFGGSIDVQGVVLKDAPVGTGSYTSVANSTFVKVGMTIGGDVTGGNAYNFNTFSNCCAEAFTFDDVILTGGVEYIIGVQTIGTFSGDDTIKISHNATANESAPNNGLGVFTKMHIGTSDLWENNSTQNLNGMFWGLNYTTEIADTGNTNIEYTSTADFPSSDEKINAYQYLVKGINSGGGANASNTAEISPDRSGFDVWNYKEQDTRIFFTPTCEFVENEEGVFAMNFSGTGVGWCTLFKSFNTTEITGSDIGISANFTLFGRIFAQVVDGSYDKDDFADFPLNNAHPSPIVGGTIKGAGVLNSTDTNFVGLDQCDVGSVIGLRQCDIVIPASDINYAGSTEDEITLFLRLFTGRTAIGNVEISNVGSWDFTNSPRTVKGINNGASETFSLGASNNQDDRGNVYSNGIFQGNVTIITNPPDQVTNLVITQNMNNNATLDWDDASGADNYQVLRNINFTEGVNANTNGTWQFREQHTQASDTDDVTGTWTSVGGSDGFAQMKCELGECYTWKTFPRDLINPAGTNTVVDLRYESLHTTTSGLLTFKSFIIAVNATNEIERNNEDDWEPKSKNTKFLTQGQSIRTEFLAFNTLETEQISSNSAWALTESDYVTILFQITDDNVPVLQNPRLNLHWLNFTSFETGERIYFINFSDSVVTNGIDGDPPSTPDECQDANECRRGTILANNTLFNQDDFEVIGNSTTSDFEDSTLSISNEATYKVRGNNTDGFGLNSTEVDFGLIQPIGNLQANGLNSTAIQLTWNIAETVHPADPLTGVLIQRNGTTIATVDELITAYNDTGLLNTEIYLYRMKGVSAVSTGAFNDNVTASPSLIANQTETDFVAVTDQTVLISPPFPITDLTGTTVGMSCDLSWSEPVTGGSPITKYQIFRSAGGASYVFLVNTTLTNHTDSGLVNMVVYDYNVTSINAFGDSEASNIDDCQPVVDEMPTAPQTLVAINESPDVRLNWIESLEGDPTGYKIQRKVTTSGSWVTQVNDTGTTSLTFLDTTVLPATEYVYRISAWNPFGESPFSNEATVNTPELPASPILTGEQIGDAIVLNWTEPASGNPINGYKIDRRINLGSLITYIANTTDTSLSFIDSNVTKPNTYGYRITPLTSVGEGAVSNVVDVVFGSHLVVHVREQDGSGFKGGGIVQGFNATFSDLIGLDVNSDATFDNLPASLFNFTFFDDDTFILNKTFGILAPSGNDTSEFTINALVFDVDCPDNGVGTDIRIKVNYTDAKDITAFPSTPVCDSTDQVSWTTTWEGGAVNDTSTMIADFISTVFKTNAEQFLASADVIPTSYNSGENQIESDTYVVNMTSVTINFNLFLGRAPSGGGGGGDPPPSAPATPSIPDPEIVFGQRLTGLNLLSRTHTFAQAGDILRGSITVNWEGETNLSVKAIDTNLADLNISFDDGLAPFELNQQIDGTGEFAMSTAEIAYTIVLPPQDCNADIGITQNCFDPTLHTLPIEFQFEREGQVYEASTEVFVDGRPIPLDIVQLQIILLFLVLVASAVFGNFIRRRFQKTTRRTKKVKTKFKKKFDSS